jgi:hypothetical protein
MVEEVVVSKVIGAVLTAVLTLSPASPAFADRDERGGREGRQRSSSCTLDVGVLRSVSANAFCPERERRSQPPAQADRRRSRGENPPSTERSSSRCSVDLGVLTRTINVRALCAGD